MKPIETRLYGLTAIYLAIIMFMGLIYSFFNNEQLTPTEISASLFLYLFYLGLMFFIATFSLNQFKERKKRIMAKTLLIITIVSIIDLLLYTMMGEWYSLGELGNQILGSTIFLTMVILLLFLGIYIFHIHKKDQQYYLKRLASILGITGVSTFGFTMILQTINTLLHPNITLEAFEQTTLYFISAHLFQVAIYCVVVAVILGITYAIKKRKNKK